MPQGIYSCHCCEFETFEAAQKQRKQKFTPGDAVKNRCIYQRTEEGIVIDVLKEKGYYNVKFGEHQSDIELKHAEELIKIVK
jgi:hypothetical protein